MAGVAQSARMTIEAVIFDFGGVIVSGGGVGGGPALWAEIEGRFNLPPATIWNAVYLQNAAWTNLRVGVGTHDIWHAAVHEAVAKVADDASARAVLAALGEKGGAPEFNEGMIPLIKQLGRNGYRVGLCSNAAPGLEQELISHYQIHGLFDDVINSATVRLAKPDPRIFALAASRIRVPIDRCFFTDDLAHNIEAARAAGMTAYQFDNAANLRAALKTAGVRIN